MLQGRSVDVVVLGLSGFHVLEARVIGRELELVIETIATRGWCRDCGGQAAPKAAVPKPFRAFGVEQSDQEVAETLREMIEQAGASRRP